jgi:hypothetical protein
MIYPHSTFAPHCHCEQLSAYEEQQSVGEGDLRKRGSEKRMEIKG